MLGGLFWYNGKEVRRDQITEDGLEKIYEDAKFGAQVYDTISGIWTYGAEWAEAILIGVKTHYRENISDDTHLNLSYTATGLPIAACLVDVAINRLKGNAEKARETAENSLAILHEHSHPSTP
jgi:hypothetical protein